MGREVGEIWCGVYSRGRIFLCSILYLCVFLSGWVLFFMVFDLFEGCFLMSFFLFIIPWILRKLFSCFFFSSRRQEVGWRAGVGFVVATCICRLTTLCVAFFFSGVGARCSVSNNRDGV